MQEKIGQHLDLGGTAVRPLLESAGCRGLRHPAFPTSVDRSQERPGAGAQKREIADHLDHDNDAGGFGLKSISPNPTVANVVMVKYSESVRVSDSVKLAAEAWAMR